MPRVLLITVVVLPVVLPAVFVILLLSLGVFLLLEGILWVPLKVTARVKVRFGKKPAAEVKQVNAPAFEWAPAG